MIGGQVRCNPSETTVCTPEQYPSCSDVMQQYRILSDAEALVLPDGSMRPFRTGEAIPEGARAPSTADDPKTKERNESEVDRAVMSGVPGNNGFDGMCRVDGVQRGSYRWFMYADLVNHLTFRNFGAYNMSQWDQRDFQFSVKQMRELVTKLNLGPDDIHIKQGYAPQQQMGGTYTKGTYRFTNNHGRLHQMIELLEGNPNGNPPVDRIKLETLEDNERDSLVEHLKAVSMYQQTEAVSEQVNMMPWMIGVPVVLTLATTVPLLGIFLKQLGLARRGLELTQESVDLNRKMLTGESEKNLFDQFAKDLVEVQRERLASNIVTNEIRGRDAEALDFLKMLARPKMPNPMLLGESGAGKDKVVERAAQLIALNDPRVPVQFYDGTIKGLYIIDPAAFTADTGIRGDSGKRNKEIIRVMGEGYAVYFPEISDFLTAGASSEGTSESLGSSLKDALTKDARFAGSTTPDSWNRLVLQNKWLRDMNRRFPKMNVRSLPAPVIRRIVADGVVPGYESYYDVSIPDHVLDRAVDLGLHFIDPETPGARIDAVEDTLLSAVERAIDQRRPTEDYRANYRVEILTTDVEGVIFDKHDPAALPTGSFLATESANGFGSKDIIYSDRWMELLEQTDPWFQSLSTEQKREGVRLSAQWLLAPKEGDPNIRDANGTPSAALAVQQLRARGMTAAAPRSAPAGQIPAARPALRTASNDPVNLDAERFLRSHVVDFADYGMMDQMELITEFESEIRTSGAVGQDGKLRVTEDQLYELLRQRVERSRSGEALHGIKLHERRAEAVDPARGPRGEAGGPRPVGK